MDFTLGKEQAVYKELEIAPQDFHLGVAADIDHDDITLRVAEQPVVLNYYKLAKLQGKELAPEMKEMYKRQYLWIITHSVGITDSSKFAYLTEFGYRVQFGKGYNVQVLSLFPETCFIRKNVSGNLSLDVDVNAKGAATLPEGEIQIPSTPIGLQYGGKLNVSANAGLSVRLNYQALSTSISVMGKYSAYSEWSVAKEDKPLVGDQIFTQIVAAEKGLRKIVFAAQVHATVTRFGIFHSRRESSWISIELQL